MADDLSRQILFSLGSLHAKADTQDARLAGMSKNLAELRTDLARHADDPEAHGAKSVNLAGRNLGMWLALATAIVTAVLAVAGR